jgi:hypothetical protein
MKTPTTANRIAALVRYINAVDVRQGRPSNVADRKALPNDLNVRLGDWLGDRVLLADIDNNTLNQPFAVLTMDEAQTSKEIPGDRDYGDDDCVTHRGVLYLVVSL